MRITTQSMTSRYVVRRSVRPLQMEKTKVTSGFTTDFSIGFTNEMGFIDETTCAPTPPVFPMASSLDEDDTIHIPIENILELDRRLLDRS